MLPAEQFSADAGSHNGFHSTQPVVSPPDEITKVAEDFCTRYPVDANAMDYLLTSSPEVQARVVQEFRPRQEGEGDYSALLTSFVKRCRGDARAAGAPPGAPPPQAAAMVSPPTLGSTIVGAGGQLLTLSPSGVYVEVQQSQTEVAPRSQAFTTRQESPYAGAAATPMPPDQPPPGTLDAFLQRYPIDERALDYFSCQRPEVQERILRDFRPPREGDNDYSSLFMSFVKRCKADARYAPTAATSQFAAPVQKPLTFAMPAPLLASGGGFGAHAGTTPAAGAGAGQEVPTQAGAGAGLEALAARYPIDERACDYFSSCTPDVQEKVLRDFRPPREGEADYSSLFMSFVKRCRQGARLELYQQTFPAAQQMQAQLGGAPGAYVSGCGGIGSMLSPGPEGLEAFRQRFPIDERAMAYLCESSEEVRERVLNTFVPPQPTDVDFSAPVTAYVRECRRLLDSGAAAFAAAAAQQQLTTYQPPLPQQPMADASGAPTGPGGFSATVGAGTTPDGPSDELNNFLSRYPVDARALDYLSTSSPGVIGRVLREFSPKQEGEADYSPLVMAFTKRLRGEERVGVGAPPGGFLDPPWKRPRAY